MRLAAVAFAVLATAGAAAGGSFPGQSGLIVFQRSAAGADPQLVTVSPATGAETALGAGSEAAWSPDGARLALVEGGVVSIVSLTGAAAIPVGAGDDPAWSPDGASIVVSRADAAGVRQLVVLSVADGSATQLTSGTENATLPSWSPDGSTLAFATGGGLATVPAAGGTVTPIPLPTPVDGGPSWSPDGGSLAFVAPNGQVWTTHADGSAAHQVTYTLLGPGTPASERPAWSPDGGRIAWTAGADLCVTDLGGAVTRLTRTAQTTSPAVASLPDWQPSRDAPAAAAPPPPSSTDSIGCDWNPGARVELLPANASPSIVALKAQQQIVFVNHLTTPLTVTTTMPGSPPAAVPAGGHAALPVVPGTYDFAVTGYPDGAARRGSLVVSTAGTVTIEQHAAIRYGTRTTITGASSGAVGPVVVKAKPMGAAAFAPLATVQPAAGRWTLGVGPSISTRYAVSYGGAAVERLLRVKPDLRAARRGRGLRLTVRPVRPLAGQLLFLFRLGSTGWKQVRTLRIGARGVTLVARLPAGRYYVGYQGGAAYWSTATEPFTLRG